MEYGKAYIEVRARADKLKGDLDAAGREAETKLGAIGGRMQSTGAGLTKTLTPAVGAMGLAFKQAFSEFDTGADTIVAKAGLTGDALDGAIGSMKSISSEVNVGLSQIGATIGDVAKATGLTGPPLEEMSKKLLQLGELGQQFDAMQVQRFLGDWGIAAADSSKHLDRMYKISQVTGIEMGRLMDVTVQFGAPLRALGFGVEESTLMLAKWEQEGVNTEAILAGMKMGLGKIAKGMGNTGALTAKAEVAQQAYNAAVEKFGKDSPQAELSLIKLEKANRAVKASAGDIPSQYATVMDSIKNSKTEAEAFSIAIRAFGQRAGPDLAKAVLEGRFELDALAKSTADSTDQIEEAYESTLDWGDKLGMLQNKLYGVIGPVGEYGMALAGITMGIGPLVAGAGKVIGMFAAKGVAAAAATPAVAAEAAATAASGVAATGASGGFMAFAASLWATMAPILAVMAAIAALVAAGYLIVRNWDTIKSAAGATWGWIEARLASAARFIGDNWLYMLGPLGAIIKHQEALRGAVGTVWDWIMQKIGAAAGWIMGIPRVISGAFVGVFDGLIGSLKDVWNAIARVINGLDFKIPGWIPGPMGGKTLGFPDMPMLAAGGTITGGGFAMVGEAGPERLWLPRGAQVEPLGRGGSGTIVHVVVHGSVVSERQLVEAVRDGLYGVRGQNTSSLGSGAKR